MRALVIVAVLLVCAVAAAKKFDPSPPYESSEHSGRFQLVQLGDMRADQFLLDTKTGAIWRAVCERDAAGNCKTVWERERVYHE